MNKLFKTAAFAVVLAIGFSSCSKDSDNDAPEYAAKVTLKDGETKQLSTAASAKNTEGTISRKGNVYAIRDLRQVTITEANGTTKTTANANYFFDFKENDATAEADGMVYFPTNSRAPILKSNEAKGYTLSYIDKAFETTSAKDQFTAVSEKGLGLNGFPNAEVIGWLNYARSTSIVTPVTNRTYVISKAGKALFKFRVNSVYSNEKPEKDAEATNYYFYSVDYQEFK